MNLNLCLDAVPAFLGFFDLSVAPPMLFYVYIPIFIISILFGFLIFLQDRHSSLNKYFLGITLSFAAWIFLIMFQWTGAYLETVHLAWQLLIIPEISIYIFSVLFSYNFLFNKNVPAIYKYMVALLFIGASIITPTVVNVEAFDLLNCEGVVGQAWPWIYVFEIVAIGVIVLFAIEKLIKARSERLKTILFSLGMVVFLSTFWFSNYFGELTQTYEINLIGPIGIALFFVLLSYVIIRFKSFNTKLISAQILMTAIWFLVLGILFVGTIENVRIITSVTLILVTLSGVLLVRSVRREVSQKEQLAKLNADLQMLIKQRESLVHLVTHKVKGAFTRSKYIFAGILDGTFGDVSPEIKKRAAVGVESDNGGIQTVDLVLNVSNMQTGTIKYEMKPVDLKELAQKTISEKKVPAEAKGLKLGSDLGDGNYTVSGDAFWLKEVMNNLVDNSIKYTPAGKITVGLKRTDSQVIFSVKDTGLGITDEDKKNLFTEGGRGKDSVKINVDSTGYGLFSVKLIIDAHKGQVWGESEGPGKGSQFYVELPIMQK